MYLYHYQDSFEIQRQLFRFGLCVHGNERITIEFNYYSFTVYTAR